jgi:hypothetical protein
VFVRETRAAPISEWVPELSGRRAPVPDPEVVLRALIIGLCAFVLVTLPAAAQSQFEPLSVNSELEKHVKTLGKDRQVLAFFAHHRWLLTDPRFAAEARRQIASHRASLAAANRRIVKLRVTRKARRLAAVEAATPASVICKVFGDYCREALAVAQCESGLQTTATNGQYLGLFQMGSSERRLFGHGETAATQVAAAYRYFVASGRDWSPWSCRP